MPTESVEANQALKKGGSALAGLRIEKSEAVRNEVQANSACADSPNCLRRLKPLNVLPNSFWD
jgi:hypothetical protein